MVFAIEAPGTISGKIQGNNDSKFEPCVQTLERRMNKTDCLK